MAWEKGFGKMIVETDSVEIFQLLQSEREETDNSILKQIRVLLAKDWEVKIMRTERKWNGCADLLAKKALSSGIIFKSLSFIPHFINNLYCADVLGANCKNLFNYV